MTADDKPIGLMRLEIASLKRQSKEALDRLESLYWACENGDWKWLESACKSAGETLRKFRRFEDEEDE